MRRRPDINLAGTSLLVAGVLCLAGCANTNRVGTLNRETSGAKVATTLEKQLAVKGFPSATVTCKKTLVVNVGTTETCRVTGAGANSAVQFTFKNYTGTINLASVKTS